MTFYSIGLALYTGEKHYTIFPLNFLLLPIIRLFKINLDVPIYMLEEAAHDPNQ